MVYTCTVPDLTHTRLLGRFIRETRTARGWSIRALAHAAAGVSHSTVIRLEHGQPVAYRHLVAVLWALDFSLVVVGGHRPPVSRIGESARGSAPQVV